MDKDKCVELLDELRALIVDRLAALKAARMYADERHETAAPIYQQAASAEAFKLRLLDEALDARDEPKPKSKKAEKGEK